MTTEFPTTQRAVQFVGADEVTFNPAKPVPVVGPTQLLLQIEACGICFSDTKLLHAFAKHPRKSAVLGGLSADELAKLPGYAPGELPVTPGHEVVARIAAVGAEVTQHSVGERVLVQTDYRHLPTAASNAAFGYTFDGGLEEYAVVDERMVVDPVTGEHFLIPVGPEPAAAAVALVEPWACVEAAYAWGERQTLKPGGKLLVVVSGGRTAKGVEKLLAQATPAAITAVGELTLSHPVQRAASLAALASERFDDIIYFGADADTIEQLELLLGPGAVLDIVQGGEQVSRPVLMDVGRVHYDLIRYVGTPGDDASVGYGYIPPSAEIREGEHAAIIGAAGPMGLMHVIRTLVSDIPGIEVEAVDVDDARLSHLEATVAPVAAKHGVPIGFANSKRETLPGGYSYVAVMVPVAPLLVAAIGMAGPGAIVNAFAGFPIGTKAEVELNSLLEQQIYLVGTSGSRIQDMRAMLAKVEAGVVDTNVSLDAVTGLEGVPDALNAVLNRTLTGKIMVYPTLDLGLTRIADLGERFPEVAAALPSGLWNRAAEKKLLQLGARNG